MDFQLKNVEYQMLYGMTLGLKQAVPVEQPHTDFRGFQSREYPCAVAVAARGCATACHASNSRRTLTDSEYHI